nr:MAG TPA: hypothetical protein [Bacteriophage sp.]
MWLSQYCKFNHCFPTFYQKKRELLYSPFKIHTDFNKSILVLYRHHIK